eukprot:scaffold2929_cov138-Skeletonema_marinoi.AAC.3
MAGGSPPSQTSRKAQTGEEDQAWGRRIKKMVYIPLTKIESSKQIIIVCNPRSITFVRAKEYASGMGQRLSALFPR